MYVIVICLVVGGLSWLIMIKDSRIMGTGVFILDKMLNSLLLCCVLCLLAMLTSIMSAVVLKNTIGRSRPLVNESFILSSKLMIEVKVAKDNDPQSVFEIVIWSSVNLPIHVPAKSRHNKLVKIVKYIFCISQRARHLIFASIAVKSSVNKVTSIKE